MTHSLWEYAHADHIAEQYDEYFAANSLFEFDEAVLQRYLPKPGRLVDLGCGTGRHLMAFARRGFRCLAVDLSPQMLSIVGRKAALEQLPIDRVLANMVELDCLQDAWADYCICMFSTFGMVQGAANRQEVLRHVRRIVKPGGTFVLHAHNRWYNLFDPVGRWWLLKNTLGARWQKENEPGDKFFDYRGISKMYLHVFTRRELKAVLTEAGFSIEQWIALDAHRRHALAAPWCAGWLRANGWIIVCR